MNSFFVTFGAIDGSCCGFLVYRMGTEIRKNSVLIAYKLTSGFHDNIGPGSVHGISTGYGLSGPGIESQWGGKIFRNCPDRPWGPPSLLYNRYRAFPCAKERPGRDADPSPPSSAVVKKSTSILLLPLWAVRPVQSLSQFYDNEYSYLFYCITTPNNLIRIQTFGRPRCLRLHSSALSSHCYNIWPPPPLVYYTTFRTSITDAVLPSERIVSA